MTSDHNSLSYIWILVPVGPHSENTGSVWGMRFVNSENWIAVHCPKEWSCGSGPKMLQYELWPPPPPPPAHQLRLNQSSRQGTRFSWSVRGLLKSVASIRPFLIWNLCPSWWFSFLYLLRTGYWYILCIYIVYIHTQRNSCMCFIIKNLIIFVNMVFIASPVRCIQAINGQRKGGNTPILW